MIVSVIIVNYKSWSYLKDCLSSLEKANSNAFDLEVIVVDNCSNDGRLEEFSNQFKNFIFLKNSGNNGFSHGCNFGASKAKGDYLLFLNPDTIAEEDAISKLLATSMQNPEIGIVTCAQVNTNGRLENQVRFFPKMKTFIGLFRFFYKKRIKKKINLYFNAQKEVIYPEWVSGSVVFISKTWYEKVGGWNEDYWMYFEDIDLCKKVDAKGGKVALLRNASIVHSHGGASRINVKTAVLTKTEVKISKHVYIQNHFENWVVLSQVFLVAYVLISQFIVAIVGSVFFFIPKLRVQLYQLGTLLSYYIGAVMHKTWLSPRSINYLKNK